jgi:hypothetical protein
VLWDVKLRRGELESKPADIKSASSLLPDSFVFQLDVFHEVIYIYIHACDSQHTIAETGSKKLWWLVYSFMVPVFLLTFRLGINRGSPGDV